MTKMKFLAAKDCYPDIQHFEYAIIRVLRLTCTATLRKGLNFIVIKVIFLGFLMQFRDLLSSAYLLNMKTVVCFTTVIFLLSAFAVQSQKGQLTSDQGDLSMNRLVTITWLDLKENQINVGATFGDVQLRSLINFIHNASSLYQDKDRQMFYIKANMDASFGDLDNQYSVILETWRDIGSATISCEDGTNYAYVGFGMEPKYPNFSYLVYKAYSPTGTYRFNNYLLGRGQGLTKEDETSIEKMINVVDSTPCDCSRTGEISNQMEDLIYAKWNVVCQEGQSISSYVAIVDSQWILLKPKSCTYFIYAIK